MAQGGCSDEALAAQEWQRKRRRRHGLVPEAAGPADGTSGSGRELAEYDADAVEHTGDSCMDSDTETMPEVADSVQVDGDANDSGEDEVAGLCHRRNDDGSLLRTISSGRGNDVQRG